MAGMSFDHFIAEVRRLHQRAATLRPPTASEAAGQGELMRDLRQALDALLVAEEEMRHQHDALLASQHALEAERQRYLELFEFASDGYLVTDPDGCIREANRAAAALLNVAPSLLLGKPLAIFISPGGRARFRTQLTQVCARGLRAELEAWLQPRGRAPFAAALTVTASRDAGGTLCGLRWLVRDISACQEVEEALRLSEERFATAFRAIPDAVAITQADGTLIAVNDAWVRLSGYSREETLGTRDLVLNAYVDPAERARVWGKLRAEGSVRDYVVAMRRRSGEVRQISLSLDLMTIQGERCALAILRDVTERQQMEAALRESEARFRATFEQAAVGMAEVSLDGRWRLVNQRLCEILGYPREELLTHTFQELTYPDDLPADLAYVRRLLAGELSSYSLEKRYRRKDGTLVWGLLTVSLVEAAPPYFIAVIEDVTARKQMEEMLHHAKEAAEAAARAKSDFLATISHELRTPLQVILGYIDLLVEGEFGQLEAAQVETVRRIERNAQVLFELINMVLDLNRLERGRLGVECAPVALATLFADVQAETQWLRDHSGLAFVWDIQPPQLALTTDAGKLKVVVKNLVSNAIKYTRAGSVQVTACERAGGVEIRVADTGIGIPAAQREAIFEAFYQLDPLGAPGVGLGLYIVRRLVALLQGTITVESEEGRGSTFRVWVPALPPPRAAAPAGS
jgi:PAS domain S-box-containing protein